MNNINCKSWEQFEEELTKLNQIRKTTVERNKPLHISGYLFRGQSSHVYKLETTLERFITKQFTVKKYYQYASAGKFQINALTGDQWDIPNPPEFNKLIDDLDAYFKLPACGYLAYLRHHGFPSPLLDWTRSPYIAAFFAFQNKSMADYVSIYVYQEYSSGGKSFSDSDPQIVNLGPYIKTHKRHFLQQSEYTMCILREEFDIIISSHEAFKMLNIEDHDKVWKFNIPSRERIKVLKILDQYNLNSYSLFGTKDSLMETIAFREITKRNSKQKINILASNSKK